MVLVVCGGLQAVWITATLPYIVLIILLIKGITLPGSLEGIKYYLKPNWKRLLDPDVRLTHDLRYYSNPPRPSY